MLDTGVPAVCVAGVPVSSRRSDRYWNRAALFSFGSNNT